MKYIFDLDETLIQSTTLNNDAYNYALEKFGYSRINTSERITREELNFIPEELLRKIIKEKQKYFTSEWLPYRIIINKELVKKLKEYGRKNCYLWTKANKDRVKSILSCCKLERLFNKIIFDNKTAFQTSISKLNVATHSDVFIIYENNKKFFDNGCVKIIERLKTKYFDVTKYLIYTYMTKIIIKRLLEFCIFQKKIF